MSNEGDVLYFVVFTTNDVMTIHCSLLITI